MRHDVRFTSQGWQLVGWLYLPDDLAAGSKAPGIVMANAITATKEMVLPAYAERLAAAGYACLAFDFRFLGESEGEPRPTFHHGADRGPAQRNQLALAAARGRCQPHRRVGRIVRRCAHVLYLAAFDKHLKAVVAAIPSSAHHRHHGSLHGPAGAGSDPGLSGLARHQSLPNWRVSTMKTVSDGSENAMLPNPEANEFYNRQAATIAPNWNPQVTVKSLEKLLEYDPTYAIEFISPTPLLMIVGERDMSQPANLTLEAFVLVSRRSSS